MFWLDVDRSIIYETSSKGEKFLTPGYTYSGTFKITAGAPKSHETLYEYPVEYTIDVQTDRMPHNNGIVAGFRLDNNKATMLKSHIDTINCFFKMESKDISFFRNNISDNPALANFLSDRCILYVKDLDRVIINLNNVDKDLLTNYMSFNQIIYKGSDLYNSNSAIQGINNNPENSVEYLKSDAIYVPLNSYLFTLFGFQEQKFSRQGYASYSDPLRILLIDKS